MSDEKWQEWSSCQMYGHLYVQDEDNPDQHVCSDCGDSYSDNPSEEKEEPFYIS